MSGGKNGRPPLTSVGRTLYVLVLCQLYSLISTCCYVCKYQCNFCVSVFAFLCLSVSITSQVQINHQQPQSRPLPCKVCLNPQCSFSVVYSPHNGSHTGGFLKLSSDGLKPVTITSQPLMGGGMGGMATPSTSQNSSATTNNDTKKDNPFLQFVANTRYYMYICIYMLCVCVFV